MFIVSCNQQALKFFVQEGSDEAGNLMLTTITTICMNDGNETQYTPRVVRKNKFSSILIGVVCLSGLGAWAISHFCYGNDSDKRNSSMTGSLTTPDPVLAASMLSSIATTVALLNPYKESLSFTFAPICRKYPEVTASAVSNRLREPSNNSANIESESLDKYRENIEQAFKEINSPHLGWGRHRNFIDHMPKVLSKLQSLAPQLGPFINRKDCDGRTLLMRIIMENYFTNEKLWLKTIKIFLDNGANPDIQDKDQGSTALMYAVKQGFFKIVKLLVCAGAKLDIQDTINKSTALMYAVEKGHLKIVELLVCAGAKLDIKNKYHAVALNYAKFRYAKKNAQPIKNFLVKETERRQKIHNKT